MRYMKNSKKNCFAYNRGKCDAIVSDDCLNCSFYQDRVLYEIRLKRHDEEVEKEGSGIAYEKE